MTSLACCNVSDFEGRPGSPLGGVHSSATFHSTCRRRMARLSALLRNPWTRTIELLAELVGQAGDQSSTSSAVSSRTFRAPRFGMMWVSHKVRFFSRVLSPMSLP